MDPLYRSQSRESAQSGKSTKLSNSYALSSASSGSTSSRKARSADPETTVADVSSTRQTSQRPPAARALSDINTRSASDTALLSSDRPSNPTPLASTAGGTAGGVTREAVDAESLEGITLPKPLPIISQPSPTLLYASGSKSSQYGVRSRSKSPLLLLPILFPFDHLQQRPRNCWQLCGFRC